MTWRKVEHCWSDTSIYDENGRVVCTTSIYDEAAEGNQAELEKQMSKEFDLIVAAPELLEALEEMYSVCNVSPDSAPHRVKARAAIAKAKGES